MVTLNKRVEDNCELTVRSLASIGYRGLIERRYEVPDYFSSRLQTRVAAAVAFGQTPHSYDNACFAVLAANRKSGKELIDDFRSLGAPRAFEVRDDAILHWRVGSTMSASVMTESFSPDNLVDAFRRNEELWRPEEVLRLKNLTAPGLRQLDFIDLGLIPAIEANVKQKLGPLLHRVIIAAQTAYSKTHGEKIGDEQLLRLVFRALVGKVMNDREVFKFGKLPPDADFLLETVDSHYQDRTTTIDDKGIRQLVIDRIWDSVSLKHISVEILAYIWETEFVKDDLRNSNGIHATPPSIARYMTRRLPFEEIDESDRRVIEPCCGSGTFLVAALNRLRELLPATMSSSSRHDYLKSMLTGFDTDILGLEIARSCLMLADFPNPNGWQLHPEDVLDVRSSRRFTEALRNARVILCNPPFGDLSVQQRAVSQSQSPYKQVELFHNVLSNMSSVAILGFVLPVQFCSGASYRSVRRMLAERFDDVEIVTLPDRVFAIAEQETALIIAKSRRKSPKAKVNLLHLKIAENADWKRFNQQYVASREDTDRLTIDQCVESFAVPDLNELWAFLRDNSKIDCCTSLIHRGIEWRIPLTKNRRLLITDKPTDGYAPGFTSAPRGTFFAYQQPPVAYLNVKKENQKLGVIFDAPWRQPKVIMNAKRRSRFAWRNSAFADNGGHYCSQSYTCLWPAEDWSPEVLSAILNGYVANAFVASHEINRDITKEILSAIPVPALTTSQKEEIHHLVRQYVSTVDTPGSDVGDRRNASEILDAIDAAVLKAYRLPAALMTALMEYFADCSEYRPVSVNFSGPSPSLFRLMNKRARSIVREWTEEDSEYDLQVWPDVKEAIEENRLSNRKRFHD